MQVLWIRYDLDKEKLQYNTATLDYATYVTFLTRTIAYKNNLGNYPYMHKQYYVYNQECMALSFGMQYISLYLCYNFYLLICFCWIINLLCYVSIPHFVNLYIQ